MRPVTLRQQVIKNISLHHPMIQSKSYNNHWERKKIIFPSFLLC